MGLSKVVCGCGCVFGFVSNCVVGCVSGVFSGVFECLGGGCYDVGVDVIVMGVSNECI